MTTRTTFYPSEVPAHLREFFEPGEGFRGVDAVNIHPT